ncbi:J domain-containing protein [Flavobacterium alkalisoli]|uniref:J domain-containing protein n=1 Tax=Flavobacterium alkalisoli TaxID=2602769 RepID=A0A5B9FX55_9FLAO|nr:J domain-containing protein [Flavobacterium alkalisoli]QEE50889.1 J domain-containing protein [Flavobacterium alkalisoli]
MKNHYEILGVTPNCSQAQIKKAYRLLAIKYHPDKNNGDKESEESFKEILESYIILSDEETRIEYDYLKGFKKGRRVYSEPGKPSPVKFLIQIKKIKEAVMNAGGHINKTALYRVIDNLLNDENIYLLIRKQDIGVNHLIIDEALTCCIFLNEENRPAIHEKLIKLADGNVRMLNRIKLLSTVSPNNDTKTENKNTHEVKDNPPSRTAIFMFLLFVLLFIFFLYMQNR